MNSSKGPAGRRRATANYGHNNIRLNSSLSDRRKAKSQARAAARAEYLSTLPKERWKRLLYRMQPKRVAAYWFSREGGIMALKLVGIGIVVCFFLTVGLFAYFRKDLPKIKDISGGNLGGSITYYDRTGKTVLWQDYDAVKRIPVQSSDINNNLKNATVAIEDKNFYKEGAFDVRGIMRAGANDAFGSGGLQGGSTITQQLVKLNENWTNDRTISRKVKELILAVEMEREYSKDDILTGYLNIAPYGGVEYGAESAARDYFHSDAKNLTLAQASLLAAIPKSPARFSPYSAPKFNSAAATDNFDEQGLLDRQHYILDMMTQQGYITKDQAEAAKKVDVIAQIQPLSTKYSDIKAPYFVQAAKQELEDKYGAQTVARGGWKVTTTLNLELQNYAEEDVAKNSKNVARYKGDEQAMVAEDVKTGQIVAEVGGEDFNDPDHGQINYAQTKINPGSSLKPFVYAALIQNNTNAGAGSVLYDSQGPIPGYPCTDKSPPTTTSNGGNCLWDSEKDYPGPETIRYALGGSRNVPAVKASYEVLPNDKSNGYTKSINKWIDMTNQAIGVDNAYACYKGTVTKANMTQCYGSAAIGSGYISLDQEVNADATMGRMGQQIPQTYILNITDSGGHNIYKWQQPKATQVYKADTAYIINNMLSDPKASYLRSNQKFQNWNGWNIAVKTGTENNSHNGLMTAWSTQYAVVGFVGHHSLNQAMTAGHFEDLTEPITKTWMQQALTALHTKPVNWDKPSTVKSVNAYIQRNTTGLGAQVPGPTQELFPGWYTGSNGKSTVQTIDKVSGGLATSCTPAAARQTIGGANDGSFSIDIFYPVGKANASKTTTTATSDTLHSCDDQKPTVSVTVPGGCDANTGGCDITVVASQGTHPLGGGSYGGTVELKVGDTSLGTRSISDSPSTVTFHYNPTATQAGVTVTATVTDSALYTATQSSSMNTTAPITQPTGNTTNTNGQQTVFRRSVPTSGGSGANHKKKKATALRQS